jgi:hypothetical protein
MSYAGPRELHGMGKEPAEHAGGAFGPALRSLRISSPLRRAGIIPRAARSRAIEHDGAAGVGHQGQRGGMLMTAPRGARLPPSTAIRRSA